jgi:uncharacterized coiled-coil protein SlyX
MTARLLAAAVCLALVAVASSRAQQPTAAKTQEERIKELETELAALKKRVFDTEGKLTAQGAKIDTVKGDLEKRLADLATIVTTQSGNIDKLSAVVNDQRSELGSVKAEANTLTTRVNDQLGLHHRILTDVARQDGDRYVPQLSAAMAKDSFRQELGAAVHATLKTQGQFRVVNKTASHQSIAVNLVEYVLQPGEERVLDVPVGTVTTQLPGEPLVNWTLTHAGGGVYAESIDIVPKTTVQRVVESPVYYRPTVYSDTTLPIVTYRPY